MTVHGVSNGLLRLSVGTEPLYVEPLGTVDEDVDGDGVPNLKGARKVVVAGRPCLIRKDC